MSPLERASSPTLSAGSGPTRPAPAIDDPVASSRTRIDRAPPTLSLALALLLAGSSAVAGPRLLLSGFGTLGYAVLDDPDAEYRTGRAADGADDSGSFEVDSRLGLQLDIEAAERFSATLQGIAREGDEGDPEAQLEWAFLRWLPIDSVTLRAGRLALPVYALSDYREVGYANTLLRPPEDVYSQVPFRSIDGIDASVYTEFGETLLDVQVYAGQIDRSLALFGGVDIEVRDALGVIVAAERGPFRLRLSHVSTRFGVDSPALRQVHDGIVRAAPLVPVLADLERDFAGRPERTRFGAIGLSLDLEQVFVDAEYTRRRVDSWVPDADAWYVSVGTRIGRFTPYAFASAADSIEERRRGVDLPSIGELPLLERAIDDAFGGADQATQGVGLRWDFFPDVALKLQLERVSSKPNDVGISLDRGGPTEAPPSPGSGGDVVLGSVVVDFVFRSP